ncbi:LamG domain-containing protein [Aeoliella sp. ICT_H6.2]|uniref:LamG domain-containing protein n=1 Tax=Aeoliella straminimaris TaxID=2954799 RepID=A0A9X2JIK8_9BACT|nr:PEP-CTERM sorting domain-containing protein [Aeoliella straminimaris]MCO6046946.1 LamG domain-containing protein [Aeoliella straminimaris]
MKNLPSSLRKAFLTSITCCGILLSVASSNAATFSLNLPGLGDLTMVEADPFKDGDTPGNTLRAVSPGDFWATNTGTTSDNLWNERAYAAFNTGYPSLAGATDRTFEVSGADRTNAPEVQMTVNGLAPAKYEVFLVHTLRIDGDPANAGVVAALNDTVASGGTNYGNNNVTELLEGSAGAWGTAFSSLGVTDSGATEFTMNVAGTTAFGRGHIVGAAYRVSTTPLFEASIDRDTGILTISNSGGGPGSIIGYSFTSAIGALDQSNWETIASRDVDGDQTVDPDDKWTKLTATGVYTDLSESQLGGPGPGDGVTLSGNGGSLTLGNAWIKNPVEDVNLEILLPGGEEIIPITFTGNGGSSFLFGDLNFQDGITPADWIIYRDAFQSTLSGSTPLENYPEGDLDGDGDNDWDDFDLFKTTYNNANGAGSFELMVSSVPEPGTIVLLALVAPVGLLALRSRKRISREGIASSPQDHSTTMSTMQKQLYSLNSLTMAAVIAVATMDTTSANTFDATIGSTDVTIVEVDPFKDGDTPGNTVRADDSGTFWASTDTSNSDGLWREREYSPFFTGYPDLAGATDRTYEVGNPDSSNAPALRTTVNGLAPGLYEVFEVYTTREDSNADDGRIQAVLNDDVLTNGVVYNWENRSDNMLNIQGVWTTSIASLGLTPAASTSFYVEAVGAPGFRSHHFAVAYREIAQLTLEVNTTNGTLTIANKSGSPIEIDGYEITSDAGSLNFGNWNSLQDKDYEGSGAPGDGMGFEELGTPSNHSLNEAILTSSYIFVDTESVSLGSVFDLGTQDLAFRVRTPAGTFIPGLIEEVTTVAVSGDYNSDGVVNIADYTVWRNNLGASISLPNEGSGVTPGMVTVEDYTYWKSRFGATSASGSLAASSIPEPSAFILLLAACGGGVLAGRHRKGSGKVKQTNTTSRLSVAGALLIACVAWAVVGSTAQAAVYNDRVYQFGDDPDEDAANAPGGVVGTGPGSVGNTGYTIDSGNPGDLSGSYLDLQAMGSPVYVDVSTLGTGRTGRGILFDGTDDMLEGDPLNRPDEMAGPTPVGAGPLVSDYPYNYDNITARGAQMWVYPDASKVGVTRQVILMDTIAAGGVAITADGKWTQINDGHANDTDIPASVSVVGDQWYHVMHHVHPSGSTGAPKVISGSDLGFTGVVYVNGVAVSANNDTPNPGDLTAGSRVGELSVGAAELSGDGQTPVYGEYFQGAIDELEMYVFGDNSDITGTPSGDDYGSFDLFTDNEWIRNAILNDSNLNGILKAGDVNRDGFVSGDGTGPSASDDVTAFVDGWLSQNVLVGAHRSVTVGDWNTWGQGDLNLDGRTSLADALILHNELLAAGAAGLDFGLLAGETVVPEPSAVTLIALALISMAAVQRRYGSAKN